MRLSQNAARFLDTVLYELETYLCLHIRNIFPGIEVSSPSSTHLSYYLSFGHDRYTRCPFVLAGFCQDSVIFASRVLFSSHSIDLVGLLITLIRHENRATKPVFQSLQILQVSKSLTSFILACPGPFLRF